MARKLDKADREALAQCAKHLARMGQHSYAAEVYTKMGDMKSLIAMRVEAKHWEDVRSGCSLQSAQLPGLLWVPALFSFFFVFEPVACRPITSLLFFSFFFFFLFFLSVVVHRSSSSVLSFCVSVLGFWSQPSGWWQLSMESD